MRFSGHRFAIGWITLALWIFGSAGCSPTRADWATVAKVNDGDTIVLSDGRRVRYIGIDAPEIDHEHQRDEPFGFEAREANRRLLAGGKVRLVTDVEKHDRYGRLLAYVYLSDGAMVNAELVRLGVATVLYRRPNVTHHEMFLGIQREAMTARRGLWQRVDARPQEIVGNRNSLRFHLATCPSVRRIHPQNRVVFQKKWDAFWEGYAPSQDCIPKEYDPRVMSE
jgi:micrococcal nuclease